MSVCSSSSAGSSCNNAGAGDDFGLGLYGVPSCEPQTMFPLLKTLVEEPTHRRRCGVSLCLTLCCGIGEDPRFTSWCYPNYVTVNWESKQQLSPFERVYLFGSTQCAWERGVAVEALESKLADALASIWPLPPSCTASAQAHFLSDERLRRGFYRVFYSEHAPRLHAALCNALSMTHDAHGCMQKAEKLVKYFARMTEFVFGGAITAMDDVGVGADVAAGAAAGVVALVHFESRIRAWLRVTAVDTDTTRAVIVGMDALSRAAWKRHAKSEPETCAEERAAQHVLSAAFAAVGDAFAAVYDVVDARNDASVDVTSDAVDRVFAGVARRFALL